MNEIALKGINNNARFQLLFNYIFIAYAVLEILTETIVGKYFGPWMERFQIIFAIALIIIIFMKFFHFDSKAKKAFLKDNVLVFAYFIIRLATFIYTGMQYTMVRSAIFEVIYLLVLTKFFIDSSFVRKIIFKLFIFLNLLLNIINTFFYLYCKPLYEAGIYDGAIYSFAQKYTYMENYFYQPFRSMYSNPNQMGVMTGLALIIFFTYIKKKTSIKMAILQSMYIVFSVFCIWYSDAKSAIVGLLAALFALIALKLIKLLTPRKIVLVCLTGCVITMAVITGFISMQGESFTENECKLNRVTTGRYSIWKDCVNAHADNLVLGCGNISLEKQDRAEYNYEKGVYNEGLELVDVKEYLGTHNGYYGMLYCTGILGALAFLALLIKRTREANSLKIGSRYYMSIIYILVINLVECFMVVGKNYCIFMLFLILAMNSENEEVDE